MTVATKWAQVIAGPRAPLQLDRGRWYAVASKTSTGTVTLRLPDGVAFGIHERLVRFREGPPVAITRVLLPPIDDDSEFRYVGVCPLGHRLHQELLPVQMQAHCEECRDMYPIEDEERA